MDLQYLFGQPPIYEVLRPYFDVADLLVLRYIVRGIEPLGVSQIITFAREGNLKLWLWAYDECMKRVSRLYGKRTNSGERIDKSVTVAAESGSLEIVKYRIATCYSGEEWLLPYAMRHGQLETVEYLYERAVAKKAKFRRETMLRNAVKSGSVEMLEWVESKGYKVYSDAIEFMAEYGHVHLLELMLARGKYISPEATKHAALNGHIHVLQWLYDRGLFWKHYTIYAAQSGRIDVLEWMYTHGCRPCKEDLYFAVVTGHFVAAKWLLERGALWPDDICISAVRCGSQTLEWVLDNGAPWDNKAYLKAVKFSKDHCIAVMRNRGLVQ
jgi:hypothetical protein